MSRRVELRELVSALERAVIESPGAIAPPAREDLILERSAPPELAELVRKIRREAATVTDDDVRRARDAGASEEEIFEATICAALGAGLERLAAGLAAVRRGG
jgi:alkylhydroperoxidase family enzyme